MPRGCEVADFAFPSHTKIIWYPEDTVSADTCLTVNIEDCEFEVYIDTDNTAHIYSPMKHGNTANIPCAVISNGDTFRVTQINIDKSWSGFVNINIPSSVVEIGGYFDSLYDTKNINVSPDNKNYCSVDGILYTKDTTELIVCPRGKEGEVFIPSSINYIEGYTFSDCDKLTSINVYPDNKKYCSIDGILYTMDTTELIVCPRGKEGNVVIPSKVTKIDYDDFTNCHNLTNIYIPSSVTYIDKYAFEYCSNLKNIDIPSSVTFIGSSAFYGCDSLKTARVPKDCDVEDAFPSHTKIIWYPEDEPVIKDTCLVVKYADCEFKVDTVWSASGSKAIINGPKDKNIKTAKIPCAIVATNGDTFKVTEIGAYAFADCTNLTSVEIPTSVTTIGKNAFSDCIGLTDIEIPSSVAAFSYCTSLTSIEIPSSVTKIGNNAFSGCSSLTSIEIPSSVTSIGSSTFSGCTSLTSIEIPSSVTKIGNSAFSGCSSLTSIEIPSSVILSEVLPLVVVKTSKVY